MGQLFTRRTSCPWCGKLHDAHSSGGDRDPQPGDLALCWGCEEPAIFTETLELRKPTDEEMADIKKDPKVGSYLRAMHAGLGPTQAARLGHYLAGDR